MKANVKLERGGWTPALRKMAIDIMDKMILRPISMIISDPRNGNINTFQGIREKLSKRKYAFLNNWKEEVMKVFTIAKAADDQLVNDICSELELFFLKRYNVLEQFSEFKFKSCLENLLNEDKNENEEEAKNDQSVDDEEIKSENTDKDAENKENKTDEQMIKTEGNENVEETKEIDHTALEEKQDNENISHDETDIINEDKKDSENDKNNS